MPRPTQAGGALLLSVAPGLGCCARSLQPRPRHQGSSWPGPSSVLPSVTAADSAAGRLLVSAIRRLTPTSHWLTSFTWSTMSERWISSATSQCCCCSSARTADPLGGAGSAFPTALPCPTACRRPPGSPPPPSPLPLTSHQEAHPLPHWGRQLSLSPGVPQHRQPPPDVVAHLFLEAEL